MMNITTYTSVPFKRFMRALIGSTVLLLSVSQPSLGMKNWIPGNNNVIPGNNNGITGNNNVIPGNNNGITDETKNLTLICSLGISVLNAIMQLHGNLVNKLGSIPEVALSKIQEYNLKNFLECRGRNSLYNFFVEADNILKWEEEGGYRYDFFAKAENILEWVEAYDALCAEIRDLMKEELSVLKKFKSLPSNTLQNNGFCEKIYPDRDSLEMYFGPLICFTQKIQEWYSNLKSSKTYFSGSIPEANEKILKILKTMEEDIVKKIELVRSEASGLEGGNLEILKLDEILTKLRSQINKIFVPFKSPQQLDDLIGKCVLTNKKLYASRSIHEELLNKLRSISEDVINQNQEYDRNRRLPLLDFVLKAEDRLKWEKEYRTFCAELNVLINGQHSILKKLEAIPADIMQKYNVREENPVGTGVPPKKNERAWEEICITTPTIPKIKEWHVDLNKCVAYFSSLIPKQNEESMKILKTMEGDVIKKIEVFRSERSSLEGEALEVSKLDELLNNVRSQIKEILMFSQEQERRCRGENEKAQKEFSEASDRLTIAEEALKRGDLKNENIVEKDALSKSNKVFLSACEELLKFRSCADKTRTEYTMASENLKKLQNFLRANDLKSFEVEKLRKIKEHIRINERRIKRTKDFINRAVNELENNTNIWKESELKALEARGLLTPEKRQALKNKIERDFERIKAENNEQLELSNRELKNLLDTFSKNTKIATEQKNKAEKTLQNIRPVAEVGKKGEGIENKEEMGEE